MGNTISAASLDVESDEDLQETLRWCQDTKRCPGLNCGQLTMSSGGGDDITCQMCGHRYCWVCLHPVHRGPVPPCLDCRETGVTQLILPPAAALVESIRDAADVMGLVGLTREIAGLIVGYLPCQACGGSGNMIPPNAVGPYVGCNGWNHH